MTTEIAAEAARDDLHTLGTEEEYLNADRTDPGTRHDAGTRDPGAAPPAPDEAHPLLMTAHWRAAHDGLEGLNIDMATRQPRFAGRLLRRLFDYVRPELERHGDLETVSHLPGRLREHGTGAALPARGASIGDIVDRLARATRSEDEHKLIGDLTRGEDESAPF